MPLRVYALQELVYTYTAVFRDPYSGNGMEPEEKVFRSNCLQYYDLRCRLRSLFFERQKCVVKME